MAPSADVEEIPIDARRVIGAAAGKAFE